MGTEGEETPQSEEIISQLKESISAGGQKVFPLAFDRSKFDGKDGDQALNMEELQRRSKYASKFLAKFQAVDRPYLPETNLSARKALENLGLDLWSHTHVISIVDPSEFPDGKPTIKGGIQAGDLSFFAGPDNVEFHHSYPTNIEDVFAHNLIYIPGRQDQEETNGIIFLTVNTPLVTLRQAALDSGARFEDWGKAVTPEWAKTK